MTAEVKQKKKSKMKEESALPAAEERRLNALSERYKTLVADKNSIKVALSGKSLPNTKIRFDDSDHDDVDADNVNEGLNSNTKGKGKEKRNVLFDETSESEEELEQRFRPDKPSDVVRLQSKYASDPRFTLDERFFGEQDDKNESNAEGEEEKDKAVQMEVLESLLGYKVRKNTPKDKAEHFSSIVRFDPLRHGSTQETLRKRKKDEVDTSEQKSKGEKKKNKKEKKQSQQNDRVLNKELEPILKETFYEIKSNMKEIIKGSEGKSFSLLETFGPVESEVVKTKTKLKSGWEKENTATLKKFKPMGNFNPFKYDSSESEEDESGGGVFEELEAEGRVQSGRVEAFFFVDNDPRLEEGKDFCVQSHTVGEAHDFSEVRKQLKAYVKTKANRAAYKASKLPRIKKKNKFFMPKKKKKL